MTAAAEQVYDDPQWRTFCAARDAYARAHRHEWPTDLLSLMAQRAGLDATLSAIGGEIPAVKGPGVFCTSHANVAQEMARGGQWRRVGDNDSWYVLEPAYVPRYPPPSTEDGAP